MKTKLRPIAIYLPQFHPVPENDAWWGKGFTEWTNVSKARPLFKGHHQPHLPADMGFYDLRLKESRMAQAELARQHGIYGFCYYHYWFNGRRILERPFQEVYESSEPDLPFMLCWANENWTRKWDGGDSTLLLKQEYSRQDALKHISTLIKYFKDPRYIRIDGKPVFAFYKTSIIPNIFEYTQVFREEAAKNGMELYLCRFENFGCYGPDFMKGFDAAIEFQPFTFTLDNYIRDVVSMRRRKFSLRLVNRLLTAFGKDALLKKQMFRYFNWFDYSDYVNYILKTYKYPQQYKRFPGVMPGWDNTARRGEDSMLFKNSSPSVFSNWLEYHERNFRPYSNEENFLFINAWNEWAEGNHLEPCQKWGLKYLEAVKKFAE